MKDFTHTPFTRFIILVVMFNIFQLSTTHYAMAQCFQPAVVNENGTDPGNITVGGNTGNDIKIFDTEIMRVNVWDGSYCGLGWNYFDGTTTHTGFLVIDDSGDPDVSLVHNGTTWFALVSKVSTIDGGIYLDVYELQNIPVGFVPLAGNIDILLSSSAGAYNNNVNIDADVAGNFAVIWDDLNSGDIEMFGGTTATNNIPTLSANGMKTIPNTFEFIQPDVSLYTNYNNDILVNYSYLDPSTSTLYVGTDLFTDLTGSSNLSNSSPFSEVYSGTIDHPRVASAPTDALTNDNLWTVVATHIDNGRIDIVGHTLWASTVYDYVYTDGSMSANLCDIGSDWYNRFPVVTYCNATRGLVVGWASTYDQSIDFNPYGLVALRCLYDGSYYPITQGMTTYDGFLIVNSDNPNNDWEYMLSVAGRDGDLNSHKILYSFYYENDDDLIYKEVDWLAPTLRLEEKISSTTNIYPNPFSNSFNIQLPFETECVITITDMAGRMLYSQQLSTNAKVQSYSGYGNNLNQGLYLLTVTDINNGTVSRTKIVKQ
ncbi:hypothetical protein LBMAG25_17440 [Bacteroidota bacterium]|nr:hypothetical protein LBMAG25_17440 [Bacteroidota bacterium]